MSAFKVRSILCVPAHTFVEREEKARAASADRILVDFEDGLPRSLDPPRLGSLPLLAGDVVRVPGLLPTMTVPDDVLVMVPKIERRSELSACRRLWPGRYIPTFESPAGLSLAELALEPWAMAFGRVDYASHFPLLARRAVDAAGEMVAAAAAGLSVAAWDGPSMTLDPDVVRGDTERAIAAGFTGRACIHPAQVPIVNAAFDEARSAARRRAAAITDGEGVSRVGLDFYGPPDRTWVRKSAW